MELRKYHHFIPSLHSQPSIYKSSHNIHFQQIPTQTSINQQIKISKISSTTIFIICFIAAILIIIIIIICYRKYRTRQMYQQTPQNFTSRPKLSFKQIWKYQQQIKSFTPTDQHRIIRKQTYDGKYIQVTFKSNNNCIYFPNQLTTDCYFQIQLVKLSSTIQIGFVHADKLLQIVKKHGNQYQFNLDKIGVSVRSDGSTWVYGTNKISFNWTIQSGDTMGIGITQHPGTRRVWITRNGVIQNQCTEDQKIKYLDIKEQKIKNKMAINKQKKYSQSNQSINFGKNISKNLQLQQEKILIENNEKFKYYAVIVSENGITPYKQSIINWNVGGQNFRLFDATKLATLLK